MAITISGISKTKVLSSLDTYNHTALQSSIYTVVVQLSEVPPSGMSIDIQQNSSSKASVSAPQASQSHMELQVKLNCTANDVISVVLASSSAIDKQLNNIKATLKITPGLI